jgi:protein MpaA
MLACPRGRWSRRLKWAALLLALSHIAGCAIRPAAAARDALPAMEAIGRSVQGRDIQCLTITGPSGAPQSLRVMFIASIHGDEPAGTPLVQRLLREAQISPAPQWMRGRQLIVIPVANPDGLAAGRRGNANGIDLNRNFPATSFTSRRRHGDQPLSEPESLALHAAILKHNPDRIISMHQPIACIDYDGPGAELAQAMAKALPAEHRLRVQKLGAYPGSLGSFAGEDLGIPIITVELPGAAHRLSQDELWNRYGAMLIAAVEFP